MQNGNLKEQILKETEKFPGKTAVLYKEYGNPERDINIKGDVPVVSASTIKVPVMMALFWKVQEEKRSLQEEIPVREEEILEDSKVFEYGGRMASLYELTVWMIVNSDNTATNVLISWLGMDWLNRFFQKMGLKHTRLERKMLDFEAVKEGEE